MYPKTLGANKLTLPAHDLCHLAVITWQCSGAKKKLLSHKILYLSTLYCYIAAKHFVKISGKKRLKAKSFKANWLEWFQSGRHNIPLVIQEINRETALTAICSISALHARFFSNRDWYSLSEQIFSILIAINVPALSSVSCSNVWDFVENGRCCWSSKWGLFWLDYLLCPEFKAQNWNTNGCFLCYALIEKYKKIYIILLLEK